jgi:hypothetical protein
LLYFRHFGIFFKKNLATLMSVGIIKVDSSWDKERPKKSLIKKILFGPMPSVHFT